MAIGLLVEKTCPVSKGLRPFAGMNIPNGYSRKDLPCLKGIKTAHQDKKVFLLHCRKDLPCLKGIKTPPSSSRASL